MLRSFYNIYGDKIIKAKESSYSFVYNNINWGVLGGYIIYR